MSNRLLGILAGGALLLGGCAGSIWDPNTWADKSRSHDPVLLAVSGPLLVDVSTFSGNVVVNADPRNTFATVKVKLEATQGYGRSVEADVSMDHIQYSADILPTGSGQMLRVRTWTSDAEPWYQRAHVTIDVPSVDGLSVSTANGHVTALNVTGPVEIETSRGDVRVLTRQPLIEPVSISNDYGDIDYRVRGESTGAFDCRAVGGSVDQRARFGRVIVHGGTTSDRLLATLNDGTNPVRMQTKFGDIRIAVVDDPTDVGVLIMTP